MEPASLPPALTVVPGRDGTPAPTRVRIEGDRIVVERLVIADPALAAFLGERPWTTAPISWSAPSGSDCWHSRTPA